MNTTQNKLCEYLLNLHQLTIDELDELCDDPKRDRPRGQEVRAILTYDQQNGFFLSAQDGKRVYSIIEETGAPVRFRTIEQAIEVLVDMPLSTEVRLDISAPRFRPLAG